MGRMSTEWHCRSLSTCPCEVKLRCGARLGTLSEIPAGMTRRISRKDAILNIAVLDILLLSSFVQHDN